MFEAMGNIVPSQRDLAMAKGAEASMALLDDACAGDAKTILSQVSAQSIEQRSKTIWTECNFGRHGLIDATTGEVADAWPLMLGHMAFVELSARGGVDAQERILLVTVAGAPRPAPAEADATAEP